MPEESCVSLVFMFDRDRLFRVLFHLSVETSDFLVAQDAYETIRSCINQIRNSQSVLVEMEGKLKTMPENGELLVQREQILSCIDRLLEVQNCSESWISFLNPLLEEAREFWFCCPVDHTHCIGENKSPMEKWRYFKESDIFENVLFLIREFKLHCRTVIDTHFPDLLSILEEEIDREQKLQSSLNHDHSRLMNQLPLMLNSEFARTNHSIIGSSSFPRSHHHIVDPKFAEAIGFSTSRLLCFPVEEYITNVREKNDFRQQFDDHTVPNPTTLKIFYRTATRRLLGIEYVISTHSNLTSYSIGVDITSEIEASRLKQSASIQKMLKQWLHSIRNASFEQQARVILEEVQTLSTKVNRSDLREDFESISECVKLLMHTARTSVGLIDQALDTRGLTQHMCVSDFVSNITSFPHHFAQSEGIPAIYTRYRFLLNGNPAAPQDYSSFFVTGDIISLQSIVDNIISNAVR
jgi:hypothetical protein